jgi:hypothetical protein
MFDPRKGPVSLSSQIEKALEYIQDYPLIANAPMISILEAAGFDREIAINLLVYVPMAFFRVLLTEKNLPFPETCFLVDASGEAMEVNLHDQLLFETSMEVARRKFAEGMTKLQIEGVIFRSGEFLQVNAMLRGGFSLAEVVIQPAEINVDSEVPPGEEAEFEDEEEFEEVAPTGAWWKFW